MRRCSVCDEPDRHWIHAVLFHPDLLCTRCWSWAIGEIHAWWAGRP